ncbi:MAG: PBP1A family penicillin-binding protein [Methylococcaceae bacterium]|nr:PBP1A family penicillin-binding protein [Methylococcaceae bacterium]
MSSNTSLHPESALKTLFRALVRLTVGIAAGIMTVGLLMFGLYVYLQSQLPDLETLKDIHYQSPMKVYSRDGLLIGEFGEKVRYPLGFDAVPKRMVQAFLAAEDYRFYEHPGFDYQGLLRAGFTFLSTGQKRQGGSTITMQVARNFFLSNEKTFLRKIREILLAMKIESELPKDRILELYLNKIYLGNHAYGVGAAAEIYYNKTVDELELAEIATIAGLPKAPSTFNPIVNPDRALTRRDYVLDRMLALGFIDNEEYAHALVAPNTANLHGHSVNVDLPYIAEIIRNQMYEQYGENAYNNGYQVRTTIDSSLQTLAEDTLRSSLHHFDEKRRFRPIREHVDLEKYTSEADWDRQLTGFGKLGYTVPALILTLKGGAAEVYMGEGKRLNLSAGALYWAHRNLTGKKKKSKKDEDTGKPLAAGDVIRLRHDGARWKLTQIPEVGGALVSVLPKDGQVVAIAGGYDFHHSKFNRAIQSKRQPGSGFKPVIYSAALESGMTPSTVIVDSPVKAAGWHPMNASRRYYGPTPLRTALTYSRNVVAVKLLQKVGIDKAVKLAMDMGFESEELPRVLPLALGSGSASPLRMAQMYSVFANGGFRVDPYFIARVDTDGGKTVYQATPPTACIDCEVTDKPSEGTAKRVISPKTHYMMNSMLRDVVRMGTAKKALALGRSDVAGKTGTTNNFFDAWFDGYTPALVTVAWFGYDTYKTLGRGMMGGDLALPMWVKFMRVALKDVPEYTFPVPAGGRAKKIRVGKKGTTTDYEFYSKGSRFVDEEKTSPGSHKRKSGAAKAGQDKEKPVSKPRSSGKSSTRSIESLF